MANKKKPKCYTELVFPKKHGNIYVSGKADVMPIWKYHRFKKFDEKKCRLVCMDCGLILTGEKKKNETKYNLSKIKKQNRKEKV